jgi:hypothetical protein
VANFVKVARRDEIPDGTGKTVEAGGRKIALFNAGGQFMRSITPAAIAAARSEKAT